jgi:hypothetical protein
MRRIVSIPQAITALEIVQYRRDSRRSMAAHSAFLARLTRASMLYATRRFLPFTASIALGVTMAPLPAIFV